MRQTGGLHATSIHNVSASSITRKARPRNSTLSRDNLLVLVIVCVGFLLGCGGNSSTTPNPPTPPTPPPTPPVTGSVTIAAPTDGSTAKTLPVTVSLNLSQGAALTGTKVTVNGIDVTYNFTGGGASVPGSISNAIAQKSSTPKHIVLLDYPPSSGRTFPDGQTETALESNQLPAGANGGFHLVVFDAVTLQNVANATYVIHPTKCPQPSCVGPDGGTSFPLRNLISDILKLNSRGYIPLPRKYRFAGSRLP